MNISRSVILFTVAMIQARTVGAQLEQVKDSGKRDLTSLSKEERVLGGWTSSSTKWTSSSSSSSSWKSSSTTSWWSSSSKSSKSWWSKSWWKSTDEPTLYPTVSPTLYPTVSPTLYPTVSPTLYPTVSPTLYPTQSPTYCGKAKKSSKSWWRAAGDRELGNWSSSSTKWSSKSKSCKAGSRGTGTSKSSKSGWTWSSKSGVWRRESGYRVIKNAELGRVGGGDSGKRKLQGHGRSSVRRNMINNSDQGYDGEAGLMSEKTKTRRQIDGGLRAQP